MTRDPMCHDPSRNADPALHGGAATAAKFHSAALIYMTNHRLYAQGHAVKFKFTENSIKRAARGVKWKKISCWISIKLIWDALGNYPSSWPVFALAVEVLSVLKPWAIFSLFQLMFETNASNLCYLKCAFTPNMFGAVQTVVHLAFGLVQVWKVGLGPVPFRFVHVGLQAKTRIFFFL